MTFRSRSAPALMQFVRTACSTRVFTELQHGQAITVPYDGLNPLPPQYCCLKPYDLNVQTSYFEHARGAL